LQRPQHWYAAGLADDLIEDCAGNDLPPAASELLTRIRWFTEGFDTPDMREAKTLLDELR